MSISHDVVERELYKARKQNGYLRNRIANAPDERVYVTVSHGKAQYYIRKDGRKVYLNQDSEMIPILLQKRYDEKCVRIIERQIKAANAFLKIDQGDELENVLEKFNPLCKEMINPIAETRGEIIERVRNEKYDRKAFDDDDASDYLTSRGLRVRSKSEILIAEMLYKYNVLFQYERKLVLGENTVVYPDFTIYDLRRGRKIYWEHVGMCDDVEYMKKWNKKYKSYLVNGFVPFLTFETRNAPLQVTLVEEIAKKFSLDEY